MLGDNPGLPVVRGPLFWTCPYDVPAVAFLKGSFRCREGVITTKIVTLLNQLPLSRRDFLHNHCVKVAMRLRFSFMEGHLAQPQHF